MVITTRALVVITCMESGGMPLHDEFGINYEKGATTEYQGADFKYMG